MNTKKIVFVITKSNFGGAQRYVYDLATSLPREKFDVAVAYGGTGTAAGSLGLLDRKLRDRNIRGIVITNFLRDIALSRDVRALFELRRLFVCEKPDIVHLNSSKAIILGAIAARLARVPRIIATVHGWPSNEPRPFIARCVIRVIETVGQILVHETIVVAARDTRRGTTLIHNGITAPHMQSRDDARIVLGLPAEAFVIGTIGELTKNKDQATLLEAFDRVRKRLPVPLALILIGEGEDRHRLETLVRERGTPNVQFVGYREDAAELLPALDIFVLSSVKEGLPYVLIEAGYAGLPIIATNVGGASEIVTSDETGFIVAPRDIGALEHAIDSLVKNPARRTHFGDALRRVVHERFTLERMLDETMRLYRN